MATKVDFRKLKKNIEKVRKELASAYQNEAYDLIIGQISKGISPVVSEGKFAQYSDSYKEAIKKGRYKKFNKSIRPVNLFLSGDLYKSFFTKRIGNTVVVGFKSFLADIHTNQGAGASRTIRKMLPQSGERFNKIITTRLREVAASVVRKFLK